ncbi:hypothetical protein F441_21365 [Phytophthora nicotianae CJ01A1]|uniref:Uncharacterized protein n=5 Tax=Phytophthora nicotianae TaxID=4792 RepID=W2QRZ7_PHYN3|nr:hypothetical protein PPTG_21843 [Phytophthora nicotianae INRA-310]ETI31568.1 hypothetical protein F443_21479 [Phytophthora nicotianae P1569]ETO60288.1 hypothetical protein F444_21496 [Phytophthora nicotianae P1976]ETP01379.1 hypothetical protein F441_21365 [Phytophthora nicotianae CJ01A1]ETP29543.1 hypothetical protein F442_21314 [Phytophthora nicotianae P10297]ETN15972.1 hypothetical protein PPTG_21843 [Phytophthora nicotianae INRA-310]
MTASMPRARLSWEFTCDQRPGPGGPTFLAKQGVYRSTNLSCQMVMETINSMGTSLPTLFLGD